VPIQVRLRDGVGPRVDPCDRDSTARVGRDRLRWGKWEELGAFLCSVTDPELRDFYLEVLTASLDGRPDWVDRCVEQDPYAALPRLFRAWHTTGKVQRNGDGDPDGSTAEAMRAGAEKDLHDAAALEPQDSGPWVLSLRTAAELRLGAAVCYDRLRRVQERHLWHQLAYDYMLDATGNDHEHLLEFARKKWPVLRKDSACIPSSPRHILRHGLKLRTTHTGARPSEEKFSQRPPDISNRRDSFLRPVKCGTGTPSPSVPHALKRTNCCAGRRSEPRKHLRPRGPI